MNFIRESFWKAYLVVFTMTAAGNLFALLHPRSEVFIYYLTMSAFLTPNWTHHIYAVLAAVATLLSLWTLLCRAFSLPHRAVRLFRWLFLVRVVADVFGHNYEKTFVESVLANNPPAGWVVIAAFLLLLLPSYAIHHTYAFPPTKKAE